MKTKLVFSTETLDTDYLTDIPVLPRLGEWFNVQDILKEEEIAKIQQSATCWSGIRGVVQSVEHRHDGSVFYVEVFVWCED
jgi:hypothetical protein